MMSLSVTNLSSTVTNATDRVAKVGDLRKHAEVLKQQLQQAKTPGTSPQDKSKANSLSQEIINIQSQIDRLILEGQLSKLTTGKGTDVATDNDSANTSNASSTGNHEASDGQAAAKPTLAKTRNATGQFQGQESKKSSPYQSDMEQGLLIDIKA